MVIFRGVSSFESDEKTPSLREKKQLQTSEPPRFLRFRCNSSWPFVSVSQGNSLKPGGFWVCPDDTSSNGSFVLRKNTSDTDWQVNSALNKHRKLRKCSDQRNCCRECWLEYIYISMSQNFHAKISASVGCWLEQWLQDLDSIFFFRHKSSTCLAYINVMVRITSTGRCLFCLYRENPPYFRKSMLVNIHDLTF